MSADEVLVVLGGIGAIGWVNWYFLFQGRRAEPDVPIERTDAHGEAAS